MKKLLIVVLFVGMVLVTSQAHAMLTADLGSYGTLLPLSLTPPTIIDVDAFGGGLATQGSVDFAVLYDSSASIYSYFYQVENLGGGLGDVLGRITIDNPWGISLLGSGIMPDSLADVVLYSNPSTFGANPVAGDSWAVGEKTNRFFFQFSVPPGSTYAYLIDGGIGEGQVPGPVVPEPATLSLLGMGILGLFGLRRKNA
jgi:hypothetical protein